MSLIVVRKGLPRECPRPASTGRPYSARRRSLPDDVAALKAALIAERARRLEVAAEDMALIATQKLRIAKLERARARFYRHVSFEKLLALTARHAPSSYWYIVADPRKGRRRAL